MSDTENDPQPVDPPANTGGGGTNASEPEDDEANRSTDPPANTGGGS